MSSPQAKKPNGNPSQFFLPRRSSFKQPIVTRRKSDSMTEALPKSSNEKVPTSPRRRSTVGDERLNSGMPTPITNGRRYSAGDHRHSTFLDLPAFMAAGRVETSANLSPRTPSLSTRAPSKRDTDASSSAPLSPRAPSRSTRGPSSKNTAEEFPSIRDTVASSSSCEPFSARTVSKYSALDTPRTISTYSALDTFAAEDINTEDGPVQNILALDRVLFGSEISSEAKMQGRRIRHHRHTYDAPGFGGLTTPRKRTLKKLPPLAPIKTDLPPLSAAALAAHEASFANEDSDGCDVSGMSPVSPTCIERKACQEAKRKHLQLGAMLSPKRKTKEELDAEFEEVYADMDEEIHRQWLFEKRMKQKRDQKDYARTHNVYYVDHILGEGAGRDRMPLRAEVEVIRARVRARDDALVDEGKVRLDEFNNGGWIRRGLSGFLHAKNCRGDDDSDSEDDSGSDSD